MEVLEDEEHRPALTGAFEHPENGLGEPGGAPIRAHAERTDAVVARSVPDLGKEGGQRVRTGTHDPRPLGIGHPGQEGPEAHDGRRVRLAGATRDRSPAEDGERLRQPTDAPDALVEEPAHARAARARDEDAVTVALGGRLEGNRDPGDLPLAPHEAFAAQRRRHGRHRATRRSL